MISLWCLSQRVNRKRICVLLLSFVGCFVRNIEEGRRGVGCLDWKIQGWGLSLLSSRLDWGWWLLDLDSFGWRFERSIRIRLRIVLMVFNFDAIGGVVSIGVSFLIFVRHAFERGNGITLRFFHREWRRWRRESSWLGLFQSSDYYSIGEGVLGQPRAVIKTRTGRTSQNGDKEQEKKERKERRQSMSITEEKLSIE